MIDYARVWKLLYDWQTLIAGVFALVAAAVGAWAAYRVGNAQMTAAEQRDRLQGRCLAVAIYPELLELEVVHKRAIGMFADKVPKVRRELWPAAETVALIRDVQIDIPPVLFRTLDQLYLVGEAGPTLLQLISVLLQYNKLVETLPQRDLRDVHALALHEQILSGQLSVIGRDIAKAKRLLAHIHDEAM